LTEDSHREITRLIATDESVADGLRLAESTLIDDYVSGDLKESDIVDLEKNYLVDSDRKARVELTRCAHELGRREENRIRTWRVAAVALMCLVAVGGIVFWAASTTNRPIAHFRPFRNERSTSPELLVQRTREAILILDLPVENGCAANVITAELQRIGLDQTIVRARLVARGSDRLELPVLTTQIPPGDYLVAVTCDSNSSQGGRYEYIFRVLP